MRSKLAGHTPSLNLTEKTTVKKILYKHKQLWFQDNPSDAECRKLGLRRGTPSPAVQQPRVSSTTGSSLLKLQRFYALKEATFVYSFSFLHSIFTQLL